MKTIVFDIDNTICKAKNKDYINAQPISSMIVRINELYDSGWNIILFTSRNMNTHQKNIGLINANTLPIIIDWLDRHDVKYHEIHVGKPWAKEGFYVDDRAVRPREFLANSLEELEVICQSDLLNE